MSFLWNSLPHVSSSHFQFNILKTPVPFKHSASLAPGGYANDDNDDDGGAMTSL